MKADDKREYQRQWAMELRARRRASLITLSGGVCVICGSSEGLDFHHKQL